MYARGGLQGFWKPPLEGSTYLLLNARHFWGEPERVCVLRLVDIIMRALQCGNEYANTQCLSVVLYSISVLFSPSGKYSIPLLSCASILLLSCPSSVFFSSLGKPSFLLLSCFSSPLLGCPSYVFSVFFIGQA